MSWTKGYWYNNLNEATGRKDVQDDRLNSMSRLVIHCDDAKKVLVNAESSVTNVEMELSLFGPITVEQ